MEIAPVAGVRAVSLLRQPKAADASQPPFRIDASERTEDDTYSPDRQHSADTRDEENSVAAQEDPIDPTGSTPAAAEGSTIDIIV